MKIRIQLSDSKAKPGKREGLILDDNNNVIGDGHDSTYHGKGFACHTEKWAGYIPLDQIEFVGQQIAK